MYRDYTNYIMLNILNRLSLSNTLRFFLSTNSVSSSSLHPWFVTGYTDAEGCFYPSICQHLKSPLGWLVHLEFTIGAFNNPANRHLLENFKAFFGGANLSVGQATLF